MKAQAIRTIRTLLPASGAVTPDAIHSAVDLALTMPIYADLVRDQLVQEILAVYSIHIEDFRIIEAEERRKPWINDTKASINWDFWNRYRDYLTIEKNFSGMVVGQLDRLTDRTLDSVFNPTISGMVAKYGLVVGQVQSGKTSNYTGLICKAVDAGYKLIIVLAGTLNDLRAQTQLRLDEGFLGFDTEYQKVFQSNNRFIGVGRINQDCVAHSLTSAKHDFSPGAASSFPINFSTNEPIVAIVKKNTKVLEKLFRWLSAHSIEINGRRVIQSKSLLVIDDEADHASININKEGDIPSRINGWITNILGLFERRGYVGYTATPFANIFIPINDDQLFPRDFIVNLPPPSNYIGPEKIFGFQATDNEDTSSTTLPIVHRINDFSNFIPERHKKDDPLPPQGPDSLKMAIRCFILTCAIRRLRGQLNEHNSMLVHVTRYIRWQKHIKDEIVQPIFDFYRRGIEFNTEEILEEFRSTFEDDNSNYMSYVTTSKSILQSELRDIDPNIQAHSWDAVKGHLHAAASRIQIRGLNGASTDALNYFDHENGLSVIAIGGDKLSRGLTLEGLSVSYYLRASKMYDTLMQMGRWFGYRPGYVDLCRLFTSGELNEWFCHITLASEELRGEFDYMSEIAGSTPQEYALRVRTHPGVLQISASNKIRNATEVRISWSGRLVESYQLSKDPTTIKKNLESTLVLVNSIGTETLANPNSYVWNNVPGGMIREFLAGFQVYENLKSASPANLLRFIDIKYSRNEMSEWNVAIVTKRSGSPFDVNDRILPKLIFRRQTKDSENQPFYSIRKSHIISPSDEFVDLDSTQFKKAMEETRRQWINKGKPGEPKYPSGEWVRNNIRKEIRRPLLLLYFLDPTGAGLNQDSPPIVGFAISFPGSDTEDSVSYAVHEQLLTTFNQDDYAEEIEYDDEDES
ncbi:MAG: Z1 domain-containing protein [Pyrinomonadaceae bacterium]